MIEHISLHSDIDTSLSSLAPATTITNEDIAVKSLDNDRHLHETYVPLLTTVELANVETTAFEQEETTLPLNDNGFERNIDVQIEVEKPEESLPDQTEPETSADVTTEAMPMETLSTDMKASAVVASDEPQRPKFVQRLKPTWTVPQGDKLELEVRFLANPEPTVSQFFASLANCMSLQPSRLSI